jgi:hypothetical protein
VKHALPILLALVGVATPFIILWLRHRALAQPPTSSRSVTDVERRRLRSVGDTRSWRSCSSGL